MINSINTGMNPAFQGRLSVNVLGSGEGLKTVYSRETTPEEDFDLFVEMRTAVEPEKFQDGDVLVKGQYRLNCPDVGNDYITVKANAFNNVFTTRRIDRKSMPGTDFKAKFDRMIGFLLNPKNPL